jgi:DNA-binding FadR family transcriptional regulator
MEIKQKTVVAQLVKEIRSMLASGEYQINEKLPTEIELAKKFGVSRSSVREALKSLNYLGVLESHTSKGTWLSESNRIAEETTAWSLLLSYEKMRDVFVLGTALDTQVAIIVMDYLRQNHTSIDPLKKAMDQIIVDMYAAIKNQECDAYKKAFSDYFRVLYSESKNSVFISMNECIDNLITDKVCDAYSSSEQLIGATNYLREIWEEILNCNDRRAVDLIQEYGKFAYDLFISVEILEKKNRKLD